MFWRGEGVSQKVRKKNAVSLYLERRGYTVVDLKVWGAGVGGRRF